MRRGLLLVLGFCGSLLTALLLASIVAKGCESQLYLPCDVEQTPLRIMELRCYDGPFVEDGSCRQVRGVAALVLFNPSKQFLECGAVKVWQGGRLLVLESSAKPYSSDRITDCWGWCITTKTDRPIQVEEVGRSALAVTNLQTETVEEITVYYKDYDPIEKLYIGGISHSITVYNLQKGHRVVVPAFRYLSGESMVVK